jgi:hypothetical protein
MTFYKFLFLSIFLFTSSAFSQEKVYVVDGDTIHIGFNKYRFSGIDTPEMKQICSKDNKTIMKPKYAPYKPGYWELVRKRKQLSFELKHEAWEKYLK